LIEVVNEVQDLLPQVGGRRKVAAFEQPPIQNTEPDFYLVEPRRMFWRVDKADAVARVFQILPSGRLGVPNPRDAFFTQILRIATVLRHPLY